MSYQKKTWLGSVVLANPSFGKTKIVRPVFAFNNVSGEPVAWSLQHPWGPLGVLHVVEGHRKKELGSFVLLAIADKIAKKNGYALSEVPLDNELSVKLHEKCGFKLISQGKHKVIDPILVIDETL